MSSILTNFFYRKSYKKLEKNFFKNWYKTDIFVSKCCQVKSKWQISFEQLSFQRQQFNLPRVCNKSEAIFMRSNHARVSWELKYTIFENSQKKSHLIFPFDNSRFFRHFLLIKKKSEVRHFSVIFIPCKIVNGGGGWNSLHYLALTQGDLLHSVFLQPPEFLRSLILLWGFFHIQGVANVVTLHNLLEKHNFR